MNGSKQLINLGGILAVVVILVLGVLLGAMPLYSQSRTTAQQADQVAGTNDIYAAQLAQLERYNDDIRSIEAGLATLRTEISAQPQFDDVFEIVNASAEASGVTITSVTASEPVAFVPRESVAEDGSAAPAPEVAETTDAAADAPEAGEGDASTTDPAAPADPAPADPAAAEVPPQQQAPFTIVVEAADASAAASFVDNLRRGPRLLSIVHVDYADGTLTVSALAFIRTEDAS